MADLRIVDAPVLLQKSITDDVKMPTGGLGNFSIRLGDIVWYVVTKEQLANKSYVDLSSKGVKDKLDSHIADKANPHSVTKAQVGLGNVDNTADVNKPVSNAVSSAIITATKDMATNAYVNSKDGDLTTLKTVNKTTLVKAVNEVYDSSKGVVDLYAKNIAAGAGANGWTTDSVVENGVTQKQINAEQKIANSNLHNVPEKYGADVNASDNTAALQSWINSAKVVHLPAGKTYKFNGTLNINQTDINIIGLSQSAYGKSVLQYTGKGTAIKFTGSAGYPCFKNWTLTGTATTKNAVFELGTTGVDITLGGSIDAQCWSIYVFETLLKSNANSYYNRFFNCSFNNFRVGLDSFTSYNLNILLCRAYCFTDFLKTQGGGGPINIKYNSFEQFNGVLHRSDKDKCELNFDGNYVEVYDKVALPTNFTAATQQSKGAYFGGNILFLGYYSSFKNTNNKLSIAGVFRLGSFSACDYLVSHGNTISLYDTNNNLSCLYVTTAPIGYVYINDRKFGSIGANGGYSVTYNRASFPALTSLRNRYYYYDCILDANQVLEQRVYNVPTLLNGWTTQTTSGGNTVKVIAQDDGSTQIIGSVGGTSKTANAIFTIPASHRPAEYSTTQAYILLSTTTTTGTINTVFMRYFYATGSFELLTGAANLDNVLINLNIPPRI